MFVNPKRAIEEGWVVFPKDMSEEMKQKCIQPNAIDITADRMFTLDSGNTASGMILSEDRKQMRNQTEQVATWRPFGQYETKDECYWRIPGCVDVMSNFFVKVPVGAIALLIIRSTLNRNGLFITSGLYDSGFENYVGFILHNDGPAAFIAPGTRVGQLYFITAEDSGVLYKGQYNTNKGEHWTKAIDK